ncbi:hypothetical protein RYS15_17865 [Marinobacter xestospongiae]|uniref:Lipoprotein n=1 Tax=Marinobacter xestospongiae TaxID=994319 RepID=A0ABU3W2I7_9GAMM|nr:hypothetical protein [Marinobacter xestospongiae]MCG8520155.1 hypothetical protein [Pseudomonadales bacterium]MDV2080555.1 hypothetical protein [Marinobacter xestospongiae]
MKKLLIASSLVAATALSGCSSMNTSSHALPLGGTVQTDISADIEVGEKITGQSSATKILFFTLGADTEFADGVTYSAGGASAPMIPFIGGPVESVKAAAAYNAIKSSGADVIVAPRYIVEKDDFFVFGTINVTVEGYKGTIKSID